jgi:LacI family transcriptional regulator
MADEHRRANLKDVAIRAGTSIATASRVLNNTGYIAEDTRARVLKAAEELSYQPNLRAKGLRHGSSRTIGVLIPNLLNAYYTALADSVSLLLTSNDYQMLLSSTRDDPQVEWKTLRTMIGHDVDGLIWVPTTNDPKLVKYLQSQRTPAVSIIRRLPGSAIDTIVFEDFQGSQTATQHLIQLGHRRIGFVGGDIHQSSNHDRWQGYIAALKAAGIPEDPALIRLGTTRSAWGELAANELLSLAKPPTALYAASNAIMAGVMKSLHQHQVKIPEQLSLICFDDLEWFSYSNPPISAISTSHERIAESAVELLLRRMKEPSDSECQPLQIQVTFNLMVRASTAPPRGDQGV